MFDALGSARRMLDEIAVSFDASVLSPQAAVRWVDELGAIRRVVDGMIGSVAKRVAETAEGNGPASVARTLGVGTGEVRAAIDTANRLEKLPATAAAVREGRLSAREAQLITEAAIANPAAEAELLGVAERGLVPLRDACVKARAAVEDPADRAKRQRGLREWRSWTDADGMVAGRFRFTPEIGGQLATVIEARQQRIFRAHKAGADHEPLDAYAADAVAALILGDGSDTPVKGVQATVHILVDHAVLVGGGTLDGEVCEIPGVGPVDVGWVKSLLGSAFLTVVIKKGKDILTVAHLGRHVPAEVMTALIVSGRECDVDTCNQRGYLERDHIHDHAHGGPTSYANLRWLCYRHHRLKTSGRQLEPPDQRVA